MRRGLVLTAVASGLLSVLLAVAINVATGGDLPGPLNGLSWLAWPLVGVLAAVTAGLAVWQQRPDQPRHAEPTPCSRPAAELPGSPAATPTCPPWTL